MLSVVVDTEEEFDWGGGFFREKTAVTNIAGIARAQSVFDEFDLRPTYVVDYPVATDDGAIAPLKEFQDAGRAVIGAHLHPWVNPPHEEEVTNPNSYPGNLPRNLELRKLQRLSNAIEEAFGDRPTVYRAGRYGVGPNTASILEELGYDIDLSVCPRIDFAEDGGPNFLGYSPEPYWFGKNRRLLEIPRSADYIGFVRGAAPLLRKLDWWILPGVFSRAGAFERMKLTPEGVPLDEMRRFTRVLYERGLRAFVFDFHSPSASVGHTPYVQSETELQAFLDTIRRYCEFFLNELNGEGATPPEIKAALESGGAEGELEREQAPDQG